MTEPDIDYKDPIDFSLTTPSANTGSTSIDLRSFDANFFGWQDRPITIDRTSDLLRTYIETEGDAGFRSCVSRIVAEQPSALMITDSASQGLLLAISYLANAGYKIGVPVPYFPAFLGIARNVRADLFFFDQFDVDRAVCAIKKNVSESPVALILNSPNNPVGRVLSPKLFAAIENLIEELPVQIISDLSYFWLDETKRRFGNLRIYSLGKALGLPGLRLGAVVADDPSILNKLVNIKRHFALHSCPISQNLVATVAANYHLPDLQMQWKTCLLQRATQLAEAVPFSLDDFCGPFLTVALTDQQKASALGVPAEVFGLERGSARICCAASSSDWNAFIEVASELIAHVR